MTVKLDLEEVKMRIESTEYYHWVSGEYKNNMSKLIIEDILGYKYFCGFSHIIHHVDGSGTGLEPFNISNPFTLENIFLWVKNNKPEFEIVSNEYTGAYDRNISVFCDRCKNIFKSNWNSISNKKNYGCPYCANKIITNENSLSLCYPELMEEWDYEKNGEPSKFFSHSNISVWWICKKCGINFKQIVNDRTTSGNGCSACSESKGEKRIREFLIKNNLNFKTEHIFSDCYYRRGLPFDFIVDVYNEVICIEYDGILHYKDKFNNSKEFNECKKRDRIKTKYCKDNGIKLIRIPYWDFKNIEKILTEVLIK